MKKNHTSTERVFQIIENLSQKKSVSIDEISRETGIPYTTVYRILQTCVRLDYIDFTQDHCYKLSQKLFKISSSYLYKFMPLSVVAHPTLQKINHTYKETVHLGIIENEKVLYVDKIETPYKIRMHSHIGYQAELHCTALGKVITAYSPPYIQENLINSVTFTSYTPNTIKTKKSLLEEIELIKKQGFAEDNEENENLLYCIATPVFDHLNQIVGAISMSVLLFRFDKKNKDTILKSLWKGAEDISRLLGNENYKNCLAQET